ncbi:MAG: hypothetical protein HYU42_01930 [Candidatus Rokubacteria bacterium]|nr:hypothetical protein [Candidatus Rokubacteria bacterium]MBI3107437.1 hypothetical protein [Candidatus Rokubacteria bacterium]
MAGTQRSGSEGRRGGARRPLLWIIIGAVALAGAAGAVAWRASTGESTATGPAPTLTAAAPVARVARRETRPTLDPARFVGKARVAHQVAREIPGILDQLYCYCECDKHMGHKSLLSCYTDGHAAT